MTNLLSSKILRITLFALILATFSFVLLFMLNPKPAEAGHAPSDPAYVRFKVKSTAGAKITSATVTETLGSVLPGQYCTYAGKNGSFTAGFRLPAPNENVYVFDNPFLGGFQELQSCCNLNNYQVNVSASGYNTFNGIFARPANGHTNTYTIVLSPNAGPAPDTTPPGVLTSHTPDPVRINNIVFVRALGLDTDSGLKWIQQRGNVNGGAYSLPAQSADLGGTKNPYTWSRSIGSFPVGTTVCYQGRARDVAGNTSGWTTAKCFTVTGPDLVAKDLDRSISTPKVGDSVSFSGKIRNQGTASTGGNSNARFCVALVGIAQNCLNSATYMVGSAKSVSNLSPGTDSPTLTTTSSWTPTSAAAYRVTWCADILKVIPESNERNNCTSKTFSVTSPGTAKVNLLVFYDKDGDGRLGPGELFGPPNPFFTSSISVVKELSPGSSNNITGIPVTGDPIVRTLVPGTSYRYDLDPGSGWRVTKYNSIGYNPSPAACTLVGVQRFVCGYAGPDVTGIFNLPASSNVWLLLGVTDAPPAKGIDLITNNLRVTGTLEVGEDLFFQGTIENIGTDAAGPSEAEFKVDGVSWQTRPVDPLSASGDPDPSQLVDTSLDPWPATVGSHVLELCADTFNTVAETNETNNCASIPFDVEEPVDKPWIETKGGDVGVRGNITMQTNTPPSDKFNAEYLVIYDNNRTFFESATGWLVDQGPFDSNSLEASTTIYQDLFDKYKSRGITEIFFPKPSNETDVVGPIASAAARNNQIQLYNGDITGDITFADSSTYLDNPAIVFINGNLTINRKVQIRGDKALVFVVNGDITVGSNVQEIDGFYIANKIFKVESSNKKFRVSGAALGFGGFSLGRDLSNNSNPAERFLYAPRYLWLLKDVLGESTKSFQELTP